MNQKQAVDWLNSEVGQYRDFDGQWQALVHPRVPHGKYLINETGEVVNASNGHKLTNSIHRDGYTQVCLTIAPQKTLSIKTHQLVAHTYLPNPEGYSFINHIDEDKTNNSVENLEWCTANHNNHHSKSGYYKSLAGRGIANSAKVTLEDIEDMKLFRRNGVKLKDIARVYGIAHTYVCALTKGKIARLA